MGDDSREGAFESAVREALDSVAAPSVRDEVLRHALAVRGLSMVPRDPVGFAAFVSGPLRNAVLDKLGDALGRPALSELERVAGAAVTALQTQPNAPHHSNGARRSIDAGPTAPHRRERRTPPGSQRRNTQSRQVEVRIEPEPVAAPQKTDLSGRTTSPEPASTMRSLSAPRGATNARSPRILVSTTDADLVRRIAAHVAAEIEVLHTWGVVNLVHLLENAIARSVVVLDCARPGVKASSLAALADDLPSLADLVLLGGDAPLLSELARVSPKVVRWRVCPVTTDLKELVAHCTRMLR